MSTEARQTAATAAHTTGAMLLARHALQHGLVALAVLAATAFSGERAALTGSGAWLIACGVASVLTGVVVTTLIHEWGHLLGATLAGGAFRIPARPGLFTYDWDFANNSVSQFMVMSLGGNLGGLLGIGLLWWLVPADWALRSLVLAGALSGVAFGAAIEWPVLLRTARSGEPFAELSKITPTVLLLSLAASILTGVIAWQLLA